MNLKSILSECWTGYKQIGMKNKGGRQVPNCVPESVTESSKDDIIKDLDKVKSDLLKKVDVLIAKKKKLYSNVDIESPMSSDEKKLDKDIADLFSELNKLVLQKRSLKESVNEAAMNPVKKVVNAILKKHNVPAMQKTSTSVRGFHNIKSGGYYYEGNYFLQFYKVPQDTIKKIADEMKKAGVKGVQVNMGNISADYTNTGLTQSKFESVNEGLYHVGYNKGRGQGKGVFKDSYSSYKEAKKEVEKLEKQRGGSYNMIAYYVSDKDGNFVRESVNEGRGIKSIQKDLDKTITAIESEIASYKKTKGTPQEKKHIDNLKKLHPIKKKLEAELDGVVSGLYRDAELKIEN